MQQLLVEMVEVMEGVVEVVGGYSGGGEVEAYPMPGFIRSVQFIIPEQRFRDSRILPIGIFNK